MFSRRHSPEIRRQRRAAAVRVQASADRPESRRDHFCFQRRGLSASKTIAGSIDQCQFGLFVRVGRLAVRSDSQPDLDQLLLGHFCVGIARPEASNNSGLVVRSPRIPN